MLVRKLTRSDLALNQPLPWPLYDDTGHLLLREGFVLTIPTYIDRLLERGAYIGSSTGLDATSGARVRSEAGSADVVHLRTGGSVSAGGVVYVKASAEKEPVFFRAESLAVGVRRVHKLVAEPPGGRISLPEYVNSLAVSLIDLVDEDFDGVAAAAYLHRQPRDYRPNQQVFGAVICAALAPQIGLSSASRLSLVCAALTRDVGLLGLDNEYGGAMRGLTDAAKRTISEHTLYSARLLSRHGISDKDWLSAVTDHHERLDGKGYPANKTGDQISPLAKILALADSYSSMVLPSERRQGGFPGNVMRDLFLEKGSRYDETLIAALVKLMTRHPPGSIVSLASGEVAVIKQRPAGDEQMSVFAIYDPSGMPRSQPIVRNTTQKEFAITGVVSPEQCRSASIVIRRLWQKN